MLVRQLHFSMSLTSPQLDEEANQGSFKRNLSASCRLAMSVQPLLLVTLNTTTHTQTETEKIVNLPS